MTPNEDSSPSSLDKRASQTEGNASEHLTVTPQEIHDQRIKLKERERRLAAENSINNGATKKKGPALSEANKSEASKQPSAKASSTIASEKTAYQETITRHWQTEFASQSFRSQASAAAMTSSEFMSPSTIEEQENKEKSADPPAPTNLANKRPPAPKLLSPPHLQSAKDTSENDIEGGKPSTSQEKSGNFKEEKHPTERSDHMGNVLVTAEKVNDAETILYAKDVKKDSFKRRVMLGCLGLLLVCVLVFGLVFGLRSRKQKDESSLEEYDPQADCTYQCIGSCTSFSPEACGCRSSGQSDYRGLINVTKSGIPCQRWDRDFPHSHRYKKRDIRTLVFKTITAEIPREKDLRGVTPQIQR